MESASIPISLLADKGKHIPASQRSTTKRKIRESTIMSVLACGGAISFNDSKKACYSCSMVDLYVGVRVLRTVQTIEYRFLLIKEYFWLRVRDIIFFLLNDY